MASNLVASRYDPLERPDPNVQPFAVDLVVAEAALVTPGTAKVDRRTPETLKILLFRSLQESFRSDARSPVRSVLAPSSKARSP